VGPAPDGPDGATGFAVGAAGELSKLSATLAHEIGHVLDHCAPERGVDRDGGFIKQQAADVTDAIFRIKLDREKNSYLLAQIAATMDPGEAFAESFAFAIGFGGTARGDNFADLFPKCIEWVRGWFERNYDKFSEQVAA
jgi:hypothetical protein